MLSLTLALSLMLTPEGAPATADLTAKIEAVLEMPDAAGIGQLEQLIAQFESRPNALMTDTALADELLRARVVIAWAQQEPERAAAAMDEAIRSAGGRELPLAGLGTDLKQLAKQRQAALAEAGTAVIEVDCAVPCQVIVNERRSVNPTDPLFLGKYRVWVVAEDGEVEPLSANVELDVAGETERIDFGSMGGAPPPKMTGGSKKDIWNPTPLEPAPRKQLMPVWVEIVGVVAGAGLLATGVGLLAVDGRCKDGTDPMTCPLLIESTIQGATLTAVGSAMLVSFGAVLGVDRARARQGKGASAMAGLTFRF